MLKLENKFQKLIFSAKTQTFFQLYLKMTIQLTLSIIKPDASLRNLTGKINAKFEEAGLKLLRKKDLQLSGKWLIYVVHRERPFYADFS